MPTVVFEPIFPAGERPQTYNLARQPLGPACFITLHLILVTRDRQCKYKLKTEARSRNHFCRGKAISITYSECVSAALFTQYVKCTRGIITSSVACPALPFFHIVLHGTIFGEKVAECEVWFDFLYNFV